MGAAAGVAYKLDQGEAQLIEEHTSVPPDQLSEDDLKEAMQDLDIHSQPLDQQEFADIKTTQTSSGFRTHQQSTGPSSTPPETSVKADYITELERLAGLRDMGIITPEEFEAKKKQLLGL